MCPDIGKMWTSTLISYQCESALICDSPRCLHATPSLWFKLKEVCFLNKDWQKSAIVGSANELRNPYFNRGRGKMQFHICLDQ